MKNLSKLFLVFVVIVLSLHIYMPVLAIDETPEDFGTEEDVSTEEELETEEFPEVVEEEVEEEFIEEESE